MVKGKAAELGNLKPDIVKGKASRGQNSISWELRYTCDQEPLRLLPEKYYDVSFPEAKALVVSPFVIFSGTVIVNDQTYIIDNWGGSENHNWGSKIQMSVHGGRWRLPNF